MAKLINNCIFLAVVSTASIAPATLAATLVEYDFEGDSVAPSTVASDLSAEDFVFNNSVGGGSTNFFNGPNGSGDDAFAADGWIVNGSDPDAAILSSPTTSDFFGFAITPDAGFSLDLDSLVFDARASGTGPKEVVVRSNVDGFSSNLATFDLPGTSFGIDLTTTFDSSFDALDSTVAFWITGIGATGSKGTLRVDNVVLDGTVSPIAQSTPEPTMILGTLAVLGLSVFVKSHNRDKP